jgi:tRNA threonylcarbamoyl adenosine modification protein YeaZ
MLTLTVDTSTNQGTVALGENGSILKDLLWNKESSHSEKIITEIEQLLSSCNKNVSDLKRIICGIGPGSFTGLRVALSFSRTVANALKIPIIPVENCWAVALNSTSTQPISVVLDAQKNMFFYGTYSWNHKTLETIGEVCLISHNDLEKQLDQSREWITNIPNYFLEKKIVVSSAKPFPRAEKIYTQIVENPKMHNEIGWKQLAPLYLRASAAEEVLAQKKK